MRHATYHTATRASVYYVPTAATTDGEPSAGWYFSDMMTDEPRGPYQSFELADAALRKQAADETEWQLR